MAIFYEYGGWPDETVMDKLMYRVKAKQCEARGGHDWAYYRPQHEAKKVMLKHGKAGRACEHCSRVEILEAGEAPPPGAKFKDDMLADFQCPCCAGKSGAHKR